MRDFNFTYRNHKINVKETECGDFVISINGEYYSNVETGGKIRLAKQAAREKVNALCLKN